MAIPLFVGLDVGGTSMKAGVVDDTGKSLGATSLPTEAHRGQDFGLERMCETIRLAVAKAKVTINDIAAIGVATPNMDIPSGKIFNPPNLKPWNDVPVRDHIHKEFALPTATQNDANAAAYGEFWAGAAKSVDSLVFFTLGTGVGGGIIIGDMVLDGQHSHGGELGHVKIEITNPRPCGCGHYGCLEAYASATSVVKRTRERLAEPGSKSSMKNDDDLTCRAIFDAAAAGDSLAAKIVDETAFYLAVGATNAMHTIDPDMITFGGGMIAAGKPFLNQIKAHVKKLALPVPAEKTIITFASLGSDAGYIGAAACGRQLYWKRKKSKDS